MRRVAVIYSLTSPSAADEKVKIADEDTRESALMVSRAMDGLGFRTELIEIKPGNLDLVRTIKADTVFNMCEWSGLDHVLGVEVIKILEETGVTFTGASSRSYLWGSQKQQMKEMFEANALSTPKWAVYWGEKRWSLSSEISLPVIVKPAWEHCSIGIDRDSIIYERSSLYPVVWRMWKKYRQPILVEEFVESVEYQVTVLQKSGKPWVLPPAKITFDSSAPSILTFESQWCEALGPKNARIQIMEKEEKMYPKLSQLARRAFEDLDCRGYVRMDLREKDGNPVLLEVNVNPGLDWDMEYGLTLSADSVGMSWEGLIGVILESAGENSSGIKEWKYA